MTYKRSSILFKNEYAATSRTGVSLHCHTKYSKEFLDFVPYYAEKYPVVSTLFRLACLQFERINGHAPNFRLGHWEPPLEPHHLIASESESLESLELSPIVSITDHDSIQAGLDLRGDGVTRHPISMEWTVPYGEAYFHVGVHNLPDSGADEISRLLLNYTSLADHGREKALFNVLTILNECPGILIVFNHPYWDIEMIGQEAHDAALRTFVLKFGHLIHAIEINGFRPWAENQQAIDLAEQLDLPIVSGGDRHCLHHNSMINVTNAASFSEFVEEVRIEKRSSVLILPEYSKSLLHRQIKSIAQIMGEFPSFPESRRSWSQRVFFDWEDGRGLDSLASRWDGHIPRRYRVTIGIFRALAAPSLEGLWQLADRAPSPEALKDLLSSGGSRPVDRLAGYAESAGRPAYFEVSG